MHSSTAPIWYMLLWPREGSMVELRQLGIWVQTPLLQFYALNWVNNVPVETQQGMCFVLKCLTQGCSAIPNVERLVLIRHLVMLFTKSQMRREEESWLEHNESTWRLRHSSHPQSCVY